MSPRAPSLEWSRRQRPATGTRLILQHRWPLFRTQPIFMTVLGRRGNAYGGLTSNAATFSVHRRPLNLHRYKHIYPTYLTRDFINGISFNTSPSRSANGLLDLQPKPGLSASFELPLQHGVDRLYHIVSFVTLRCLLQRVLSWIYLCLHNPLSGRIPPMPKKPKSVFLSLSFAPGHAAGGVCFCTVDHCSGLPI